MSQTVSPPTSRCYGLARVSRAWSVSRAGVYRFLKRTTSPAITRRRGPTGPCRDADLADHIRREIEASDFHGEGHRKLWARLRVAGVRSSPRRALGDGERFARAPSRRAQPREDARGNHRHRQGQCNVGNGHEPDRHPRGRAGLCFRRRRTRELRNHRHSRRPFSQSLEALEPVRQGVHRCWRHRARSGASAASRSWLQLHVRDFQDEIKCLGTKLRHPSCANPRAMASPSASSEP